MKYGIIGCGLIGEKRAKAISAENIGFFDSNPIASQLLAKKFAGKVFPSLNEMLTDTTIQAIIIATPNNLLAPLTKNCILNGKHVLVEKPAGVASEELRPLLTLAIENKLCVRVGFNHRFHPSILKAKELIACIGPIMFMRGRYGHGGRLGYNTEWRANPKISGGGELIDQGVHLIDLARMFLGEFTEIEGHSATYFWDMPVEDNAFLNLRTASGQTAWLHVSCTEWKNMFSLEIYGKIGKIQIDGLGGSYGIEKITHYQMSPQMGPPNTTSWEYPMGDDSWKIELSEFERDIVEYRQSSPGLEDAIASLQIVEKLVTSKIKYTIIDP